VAAGSTNVIVPIADLRGVAGARYSKAERDLRNQLASLLRLMDLFRWAQGLSKHCSVRSRPRTTTVRVFYKLCATQARLSDDQLLTNPCCLMYHEVGASHLLKLALGDLELAPEEVHDARAAVELVHQAELRLHQAVYKVRADVRCILHLTTPALTAVCFRIFVRAFWAKRVDACAGLGHEERTDAHQPGGDDHRQAERARVQRLLRDGPARVPGDRQRPGRGEQRAARPEQRLPRLRAVDRAGVRPGLQPDHRVRDAGAPPPHPVKCCWPAQSPQIRAVRAGVDNLVIPSQEAQDKVSELVHKMQQVGAGGVNRTPDGGRAPKWKSGQLEWEAWMRILDSAVRPLVTE